MEENVVLEQEVEKTKNHEKNAKFVNPVLAWGLIAGELVIAAVIALIVLLALA